MHRNGATFYTFNAVDQIVSVTSPAPAPGQWKQTTTFVFDSMGRVTAEHLPDTSVTEHEYWPTGVLKRSHGSQTYDVSYTYAPQGRMRTMTTTSGLTTWNYNAARGFLSSKADAANESVSYTYTPAGVKVGVSVQMVTAWLAPRWAAFNALDHHQPSARARPMEANDQLRL